jgi:hypothetical protein
MNVAFLLDADNLSSASDVEHVFAHFRGIGIAVSVRRAYGGHEKLAGIKDVLRQHGMRSFVNQGKGTTDAALIVDAMDLLHHDDLPGTVAIGSSDADFAPLAVRLREAGIRVVCFALRDKADAEALALAYDDVVYLDGATRRGRAERVDRVERPERAEPAPRAERAARAEPAAKAPRKTPVARKTAARPVAVPKAAPARKTSGRTVAGDGETDAILDAVPALLAGQPVPLNDVTKQLRDAKVLGRSARSTTLLGRHADEFRLTPEGNPAYVQWTQRRR